MFRHKNTDSNMAFLETKKSSSTAFESDCFYKSIPEDVEQVHNHHTLEVYDREQITYRRLWIAQ